MRVAWTKVASMDAFSRRFPISLFKYRDVALLVNLRWEMTAKMECELGNGAPKLFGFVDMMKRTSDACPGGISVSG
jgi:hypothetical protein